jgi:hypothetical protein
MYNVMPSDNWMQKIQIELAMPEELKSFSRRQISIAIIQQEGCLTNRINLLSSVLLLHNFIIKNTKQT